MGRFAAAGCVSAAGFSPFRIGMTAALVTAVLDQASKLWLVLGYDLGRNPVSLTPFLDLVLTWNYGISYGLFQQETQFGRWALVAIKIAAVIGLAFWLRRQATALAALSIGLVIGGALGNAVDRVVFGAVADFILFHLTTARFSYAWYVFNLADAAIVAGVIGLLYDSFVDPGAAKAPRSG